MKSFLLGADTIETLAVWFGAARGTTTLTGCVLPTVTGTHPITVTTNRGFVSPGRPLDQNEDGYGCVRCMAGDHECQSWPRKEEIAE